MRAQISRVGRGRHGTRHRAGISELRRLQRSAGRGRHRRKLRQQRRRRRKLRHGRRRCRRKLRHDAGGAGGSPEGGNATDAERATCIVWCERMADTGCTNVPSKAECPTFCAQWPHDPECGNEYVATQRCVAIEPALRCSADDRIQIEPTPCYPEVQPYVMCAACRPLASDDACDTCLKTECCAARRAYLGHAHYFAVNECAKACREQDGGADCLNACYAQFPDYVQALATMNECHAGLPGSLPVAGCRQEEEPAARVTSVDWRTRVG